MVEWWTATHGACQEAARAQYSRASLQPSRQSFVLTRPPTTSTTFRSTHPGSVSQAKHHEASRRSLPSVDMVCHFPPCYVPQLNWTSIIISLFAIVILSIIGALFKSNNHALVGSKDDPQDGPAVAATVFTAVIVYVVCTPPHGSNTGSSADTMLLQVFLVGCSFQAYLHMREKRKGAISLS